MIDQFMEELQSGKNVQYYSTMSFQKLKPTKRPQTDFKQMAATMLMEKQNKNKKSEKIYI